MNTYLSYYFDTHSEFRELPQSSEQFRPERWILAENHVNSICVHKF